MDEISHKFRRVFERGGSIAITLPPEAGFKAGDGAAWRIEDNKLILSKAEISSTDIRYTQVDRARRKNALYDKIKNIRELITEDQLLASFAIEHGFSRKVVNDYRDEMLADQTITRIDDKLQVVQ